VRLAGDGVGTNGIVERVGRLDRIIGRTQGTAGGVETPIGTLPRADDLNLEDVSLGEEAREVLFGFDRDGWRAEFDGIATYLDDYGPRMPQALKDEQQRIAQALAR